MTNELARLNVKVPIEIHRVLRIYCVSNNKTLAEVIVLALRQLLEQPASAAHSDDRSANNRTGGEP